MNIILQSLFLILSLWVVLFIIVSYHTQVTSISTLLDKFLLNNTDYQTRLLYIQIIHNGSSISYIQLATMIYRLVNLVFMNHIWGLLILVIAYICFYDLSGFLDIISVFGRRIIEYLGGTSHIQSKSQYRNQSSTRMVSQKQQQGHTIDSYDEEPPALETCSNLINETNLGDQSSNNLSHSIDPPPDWYVFDPIYGVIPQETRDLWNQQLQQEDSFQDANGIIPSGNPTVIRRKKTLPPIRFSQSNNEEPNR